MSAKKKNPWGTDRAGVYRTTVPIPDDLYQYVKETQEKYNVSSISKTIQLLLEDKKRDDENRNKENDE